MTDLIKKVMTCVNCVRACGEGTQIALYHTDISYGHLYIQQYEDDLEIYQVDQAKMYYLQFVGSVHDSEDSLTKAITDVLENKIMKEN